MRLFCGLLILSMNMFAGPVIFGARGGAALNDDANSVASYASGRSLGKTYVVGPTVGVRLPLGFSVEGDALYNRQSLSIGQFSGFSAGVHSDSWEFPVMLKFAPGRGMLAPVFGAGVSVRHINNFGSIPSYLFNSTTDANSVGFVAGAGFQWRAGSVNITPEVRYTRWQSNSLAQSIIDSFVPGRNAAQVLIGITF
jgi:hypothetical protein